MSVLVRKEVWRKSKGELQKLQWFLGELSDDDAASILKASGDPNTYIVYKHPSSNTFVLALRFPSDDTVKYLDILCTDGRYKVSGQTQDYDDVIKAAQDFTANYGASLKPALDTGRHNHALQPAVSLASPDESTRSITCVFPDSPPPYNEAEGAQVVARHADVVPPLRNTTKGEPETLTLSDVSVHPDPLPHNREPRECPPRLNPSLQNYRNRSFHRCCCDLVPPNCLNVCRWSLCMPCGHCCFGRDED